MDKRGFLGLIFVFVGVLIFLGGLFSNEPSFFIFLFYALLFIVFGLIVIFNKKEDEIETIDYSKIKKGVKTNGQR